MPKLTSPASSTPVRAETPARTTVRPEIQALRAIAVAAVVVYHYWPGAVRGGFVGVDVFFVISGFLITAKLARTAGGPLWPAVTGFWARRARRLLPASLFVLLVTAIGVFLVVPRSHWQQFFSEIGASALYVQNWLLAANSVDYLAANNSPSPVQHFWSLSVEEQFYLAWPFIVLVTALLVARASTRRRRAILASVLGAVAAVSFGYGVFLTSTSPSVAYFATTVRVWEFAAGGVLTVLVPESPGGLRRIRAVVSWAGLALIVWSALAYTGATPFPGVAALVPVIGTLAVLWAGLPQALLAPSRLYALRPVQYLGDISYSVYLWHFALLILAGYAFSVSDGLVFKLGVLIVALVLAGLSKRFIEDPVRRAPIVAAHRPRRTFLLTATAMLVVVAVATSGWEIQQGNNIAAAAQAKQLASEKPSCFGAAAFAPDSGCPVGTQTPFASVVPAVDTAGSEVDKCLLSDGQSEVRNDCEQSVKHATQTWALIGDSHAGALAPAIEVIARKDHANLELFDHGHCPLVTVTDPGGASDPRLAGACLTWNAGIQSYLRGHPSISRIFVTSSAVMHLFLPAKGADQTQVLAGDFVSAWRAVPASVRSIVVVADVPRQSQDAVTCMDAHQSDYLHACSTPRSTALAVDPLALAAKSTTDGRVSFIDLTRYLCSSTVCPVVIGGVLVYRDNQHLTTTFAQTLAPYIAGQLR